MQPRGDCMQYITIKQAQSVLQLSYNAVMKLIMQNEIKARKFGGSWRIEEDSLKVENRRFKRVI